MDARHKFAHSERLGDVIVGAELQPDDLVGFLQLGGQQNDGSLAFPSIGADEGVAVHFRHHDVEQD